MARALGAALVSQHVFDMQPCPWCVLQRLIFVALALAALLGLPVSIMVPPVAGVELTGELRPGVTATDLVLALTERLRAHGVVGKIVEFTVFGAS